MKKKLFVLLTLAACGVSSAGFAADQIEGEGDAEPEVPAPRFEILSGADGTTRRSSGVYTEGTAAITTTLEESGTRGRIGGAFWRYDYPIQGKDFDPLDNGVGLPWIREVGKIRGREWDGSFLLGYQFVSEHWSLLGLIGANVRNDILSKPDPENMVQGNRWGFETVWEFDSTPTPETMFYAYASYSTAFRTAHVDARLGYLLFDKLSLGALPLKKVYVGPQGIFNSDLHDKSWKVGAHLTISEIGPLHVTIASGYDHDRFNGPGAYGLIETSVQF